MIFLLNLYIDFSIKNAPKKCLTFWGQFKA